MAQLSSGEESISFYKKALELLLNEKAQMERNHQVFSSSFFFLLFLKIIELNSRSKNSSLNKIMSRISKGTFFNISILFSSNQEQMKFALQLLLAIVEWLKHTIYCIIFISFLYSFNNIIYVHSFILFICFRHPSF